MIMHLSMANPEVGGGEGQFSLGTYVGMVLYLLTFASNF